MLLNRDDQSFALLEISFFLIGLTLFLISAAFITKLAQRIGRPFEALASQLEQDNDTQFDPIEIKDDLSQELIKIVTAINLYRQRINQARQREQAFTRYISHEFRTPMTVIRGCLSTCRHVDELTKIKQTSRIDTALKDMEQLTSIFLLLAREQSSNVPTIEVDNAFVAKCLVNFHNKIYVSNVTFNIEKFEHRLSSC